MFLLYTGEENLRKICTDKSSVSRNIIILCGWNWQHSGENIDFHLFEQVGIGQLIQEACIEEHMDYTPGDWPFT